MPNDFDREMNKEVQKIIKEETGKAGRDFQQTVNSVAARNRGKPASQITPALRKAFRSKGFKGSESELRAYADAISKGHPIKVKPSR